MSLDFLYQTEDTQGSSSKMNKHVDVSNTGQGFYCRPNDPADLKVRVGECRNIDLNGIRFSTENVTVDGTIITNKNNGELTVDIEQLLGGSLITGTILLFAYNDGSAIQFGYVTAGTDFTAGYPDTYPSFAQIAIAEISLLSSLTQITATEITDVRSNGYIVQGTPQDKGFDVFGGANSGAISQSWNDQYNIAGDTWTDKMAMITLAALDQSSELIDGKNHLVAGIGDVSPFYFADHSAYDSGTDTWEILTDAILNRCGHASGVYGDNFMYIIGGRNGSSQNLLDNDKLTASTDSWAEVTSIISPGRRNLGYWSMIDNIYCVAGITSSSTYLYDNDEYDPVGDSWTAKTSKTTATYCPSTGVVENKGYIYSGYNPTILADNDEYDPSTDTWTGKTDMIAARWYGKGIGTTSSAWAIAGVDASSTKIGDTDKYDPVADLWTAKTALTNARYGETGSVTQYSATYVYEYTIGLFGGYSTANYNDETFLYESTLDSWTTSTAMLKDKYDMAAASLDGNKTYVFGGGDSSGRLAETDEFDESLESWSSKADFVGLARSGLASGKYNGVYAYAFGGNTPTAVQDTEQYSQSGNAWTSMTDMLTDGRSYPNSGSNSTNAYVFGGINASSTYLQTAIGYSYSGDSWASIASLPSPARANHGGASNSLNKCYSLGGYNSSTRIAQADEYDISGDTWTTKTAMSAAKNIYNGATALGELVYAICGLNNSLTRLTTVEHLDPTANTWTANNDFSGNGRYQQTVSTF